MEEYEGQSESNISSKLDDNMDDTENDDDIFGSKHTEKAKKAGKAARMYKQKGSK